MDILLDTAAFLWMIGDPDRLSKKVRELCEDPGNRLLLSSVSSWEIAVKVGLKKLRLPESPESFVPHQRSAHGIKSLPLLEEAALHVQTLPLHHRDPFDRMLVCQALVHHLPIVSSDKQLKAYKGVRILW